MLIYSFHICLLQRSIHLSRGVRKQRREAGGYLGKTIIEDMGFPINYERDLTGVLQWLSINL